MDEKEKLNNQEFDLDDILREFSDPQQTQAPTQSGVEQILREFADDPDSVVHIDDEPAEDVSEGPVTEDTILLPPITDDTVVMQPVTDDTVVMQPVTGDTIRMGVITEEMVEQVTSDTIRMEPVNTDTMRIDTTKLPKGEVHIAQPIAEEEDQEAFTDGWEPEYEQPMGSYNPPPPIIVHPRSRLRELKRKLVAGPEKRYYELAGQGLGKLQFAIFLSLLITLASAAVMGMYALDMLPENRMRLIVFGQFFGLLLSALLGSFQLIDGLADLFKGRFNLNSLLVFTFIACCADGVLCLQQLRVPCCSAFSLQVTMSLWSAYHRRYTEMGQMDTLRKATNLNGIHVHKNYLDGKKGLLRAEGQVEDFMDHYAATGTPEKILNWYALGVLVVSLGVGAVAGIFYGLSTGIHTTAVACLAGAPAIAFISQTRPMALLERRLHKLGTVLCGWQGVRKLNGKAVMPVDHFDLFPAGTVKLNGVKFYGARRPDDIVAYATALITAEGGGLTGLFQQITDSRNAPHYNAKDLQAFAGGLSGTVHDEPVLVGSLDFLQQMGVELPEGIRVNHAVCVAIENQLCGLFAVSHERSKTAAAGLTTLCNSRKLQPVVTVSDFTLTDSLLRSCFGNHAKKVVYPAPEVKTQLQTLTTDEADGAALLTTREGLAPLAYGVSGARALKTANIAGLVVNLVGGVLGLLVILTLVLLGALELLTPANMLAYQLVWLIPGFLISGWTRIL